MYNNFDTINLSNLKKKDKIIDKIQSILQSKEAKNISQNAIEKTTIILLNKSWIVTKSVLIAIN